MSPPWITVALSASVLVVSCQPNYSIKQSYLWTTISFVAIAICCQFIYGAIIYPEYLSPIRYIPTPKVIYDFFRFPFSLYLVFNSEVRSTICLLISLGPKLVEGKQYIHLSQCPHRVCSKLDHGYPEQRAYSVLHVKRLGASSGCGA